MTVDRPVLALDTSVPVARVAVVGPDGTARASRARAAERPSSALLALCDEALREAGAGLGDLAGIACGAGPGSFTGLRVGLAVAKGLALPAGLPLVLVPSLEALALDLGGAPGMLLVPCLDAGKGQVYAQLFRAAGERPEALGEPWALDPAALVERARAAAAGGPILAGGSGVDRYLDLLRAGLGAEAARAQVPGPSALAVGRLGLRRLAAGERDDLAQAVPIYGRPPDITRPRPR